ncbi:MAG: hypothetical protein Q7J84_15910 [Sulfuricaulis sp.]|nr:hypothetical protein [Sulfuricaulis sp.]
MRAILAMVVVVVTLAACSEQKKDVKDTVFAPQFKAVEKARSVEDKLEQGMEKNRAALKEPENQDNEAAQKPAGY